MSWENLNTPWERYLAARLGSLRREVQKLLRETYGPYGLKLKDVEDVEQAVLNILYVFQHEELKGKEYLSIEKLLEVDTAYTDGFDILESVGVLERDPEISILVKRHKCIDHKRDGRFPVICEVCDNYRRLTQPLLS